MARVKSSPLATKKARLALPVAKKPIFESLGSGTSVGYRRNASAGTWLVRKADGKGGSTQRVIGLADDYEDADGERVLSWAQAQAKALETAATESDVSPASRITVADALNDYEADLAARKGDPGNVSRVRVNLPEKIASRPIVELTASDLRKWRDELLKTLAPATVNRTANGLRAALELAARHNERIGNTTAWKHGLAGLPDAEVSRNVILSDEVVGRIVQAAYAQHPAFGLLVEVAAVTGSRYSQIAGLVVGDLLPGQRLNMPTSKKGKSVKKVLRRPMPVPAGLAVRLAEAAQGRGEGEPLLLRPNGKPWLKSDHYDLFLLTIAAAKLEPEAIAPYGLDEITLYALRHSSIVRALLRSVPMRVVAVSHDTSVTMIERTYSAHIADHADALARHGMLDLDSGRASGSVVPLRKSP
ncbi:tyrosine-type recombinase/integrase [Magnetospirillum molischianum]|uniref:Putative Integrase family protein n=1 Tax=Magnetospirillum molischianum DSM 120 TaxID=1150626 RepID=H8FR86_MAGML|nr:hypothetical protein [Magnetospirillum molischianum]CCG40874.1 putative Integrase family protein [Magnetospirillum molischianum DSM 120]